MSKKVLTYRYISNYATVLFDVEGESNWSEDEFDSASMFDLGCYVTNAQDYEFDDCFEKENSNV